MNSFLTSFLFLTCLLRPSYSAISLMRSEQGEVVAVVNLTSRPSELEVHITSTGLEPGTHGFHIHQYGDLLPPFGGNVGQHWNPNGNEHGYPTDLSRHAGDMGNITVDANGRTSTTIVMHTTANTSVGTTGSGPLSVIGRSLVIHRFSDKGSSVQPVGGAGSKMAVGVIGLAEDEASAFTLSSPVSDALVGYVRPYCESQPCSSLTGFVQIQLEGTSVQDGVEISMVRIALEGSGFPRGLHGIRLLSAGLDEEGEAEESNIYNPANVELHGLPCMGVRKAGDWGNMHVGWDRNASYHASFALPPKLINGSAVGNAFASLVGRTVAITAAPDLGVQPDGLAGEPIATAVIGWKNPASPNVTDEEVDADAVVCTKAPMGSAGNGPKQVCVQGNRGDGWLTSTCNTCCCSIGYPQSLQDRSNICMSEARCGTLPTGKCIDFSSEGNAASVSAQVPTLTTFTMTALVLLSLVIL
mmetsp:Transcript_8279/g.21983  ORF Transcript_8279/g.21983 Transcript_8279/m.21983 type:complete len:470 (-) Transcript_8279:1574-2983(-)